MQMQQECHDSQSSVPAVAGEEMSAGVRHQDTVMEDAASPKLPASPLVAAAPPALLPGGPVKAEVAVPKSMPSSPSVQSDSSLRHALAQAFPLKPDSRAEVCPGPPALPLPGQGLPSPSCPSCSGICLGTTKSRLPNLACCRSAFPYTWWSLLRMCCQQQLSSCCRSNICQWHPKLCQNLQTVTGACIASATMRLHFYMSCTHPSGPQACPFYVNTHGYPRMANIGHVQQVQPGSAEDGSDLSGFVPCGGVFSVMACDKHTSVLAVMLAQHLLHRQLDQEHSRDAMCPVRL